MVGGGGEEPPKCISHVSLYQVGAPIPIPTQNENELISSQDAQLRAADYRFLRGHCALPAVSYGRPRVVLVIPTQLAARDTRRASTATHVTLGWTIKRGYSF